MATNKLGNLVEILHMMRFFLWFCTESCGIQRGKGTSRVSSGKSLRFVSFYNLQDSMLTNTKQGSAVTSTNYPEIAKHYLVNYQCCSLRGLSVCFSEWVVLRHISLPLQCCVLYCIVLY